MSYNTNLVPMLAPFLGDDEAANDLAGIICQFRGYTCGNKMFMQFRARALTRVFQAQAAGCGGVGLWPDNGYNETFANWIAMDLSNLGYEVIHHKKNVLAYYIVVMWERSAWGSFSLS